MHAVAGYPWDAANGCCMVTGRYELIAGERVIDLDLLGENVPMGRRVCLSEAAVAAMVAELGWTLLTPTLEANHAALIAELDETREQLQELMVAMAGIVNLPTVEHALAVAARKVAGKESVHEWIDSLPKAVKA